MRVVEEEIVGTKRGEIMRGIKKEQDRRHIVDRLALLPKTRYCRWTIVEPNGICWQAWASQPLHVYSLAGCQSLALGPLPSCR